MQQHVPWKHQRTQSSYTQADISYFSSNTNHLVICLLCFSEIEDFVSHMLH